jgi:hypothetical protein
MALAAAALLLAGCGSGSDSSTSAQAGPGAKAPVDPTAPGASAERETPKGASPVLREIYRQFPKPRPNTEVKASAKAIAAGEAACKGKTPRQVKEAFYSDAIENGNLEAGGEEAKMIAKLPSFERNASKDAAFTAGQLAADTYQATLPEAIAQFGYQGCVHSLALRLERELAPSR